MCTDVLEASTLGLRKAFLRAMQCGEVAHMGGLWCGEGTPEGTSVVNRGEEMIGALGRIPRHSEVGRRDLPRHLVKGVSH